MNHRIKELNIKVKELMTSDYFIKQLQESTRIYVKENTNKTDAFSGFGHRKSVV